MHFPLDVCITQFFAFSLYYMFRFLKSRSFELLPLKPLLLELFYLPAIFWGQWLYAQLQTSNTINFNLFVSICISFTEVTEEIDGLG